MRRVLLFVLLGAAAACNGTTAPVTEDYQSLPADQVLVDVEHIMTDAGVRRAKLRADTTYMFNDSSTQKLRGVHLEMFDETGKLTSTLTSEHGELNTQTNAMVARGSVVLVIPGEDGRTIWTEELHYDPQSRRIWSDVPTRMLTAKGEDLRGQSFRSDDEFKNAHIPGATGRGLRIPIGQ